jgi:hypothetical protein
LDAFQTYEWVKLFENAECEKFNQASRKFNDTFGSGKAPSTFGGDRTYTLCSGTTSEPGHYVKNLGGALSRVDTYWGGLKTVGNFEKLLVAKFQNISDPIWGSALPFPASTRTTPKDL